jgi:hypothetical protein
LVSQPIVDSDRAIDILAPIRRMPDGGTADFSNLGSIAASNVASALPADSPVAEIQHAPAVSAPKGTQVISTLAHLVDSCAMLLRATSEKPLSDAAEGVGKMQGVH